MSRRCSAVSKDGQRCLNSIPEDSISVECGAHRFPTMEEAKRVPVNYRYDALNPTFLLWMARIGSYATEKYGDWSQYTHSRLVGMHSPVNHIYEHLRSYAEGLPYDHFDKDVRWHLVAVAYNAMMEFFYYGKFGPIEHPLRQGWRESKIDCPSCDGSGVEERDATGALGYIVKRECEVCGGKCGGKCWLKNP
jgi:hypothetical protein